MKCKHCGSEFEGKFCPECGTKAEAETTTASQAHAATAGCVAAAKETNL